MEHIFQWTLVQMPYPTSQRMCGVRLWVQNPLGAFETAVH